MDLSLESSDLYNRRKNSIPHSDDFEAFLAGANLGQGHLGTPAKPPTQSVGRRDTPRPQNITHPSPEYADPYGCLPDAAQIQTREGVWSPKETQTGINPLPKPPRNLGGTEQRISQMNEEDLTNEFVRQYLNNVDINAAMKEAPPDFPPPERSVKHFLGCFVTVTCIQENFQGSQWQILNRREMTWSINVMYFY